jgi:putative lipoprotein
MRTPVVTLSVENALRFFAVLALAGLATARAAHAQESTLPGTVTLSDVEVVPPGVILTVSLQDLTVGFLKATTIARGSFKAEGKPPIRFELPYTESSIDPTKLYGVAAVITDARGRPLWETRVPVRVLTLGNEKRVNLVLWPATPPQAAPDPTAFALECGAARFEVTLGDHEATIVGADATSVLPRVASSVGKKFSDGSSVLSVIGEAVYMQLPTRAYRDCKMTARQLP